MMFSRWDSSADEVQLMGPVSCSISLGLRLWLNDLGPKKLNHQYKTPKPLWGKGANHSGQIIIIYGSLGPSWIIEIDNHWVTCEASLLFPFKIQVTSLNPCLLATSLGSQTWLVDIKNHIPPLECDEKTDRDGYSQWSLENLCLTNYLVILRIWGFKKRSAFSRIIHHPWLHIVWGGVFGVCLLQFLVIFFVACTIMATSKGFHHGRGTNRGHDPAVEETQLRNVQNKP